MNNAPTPIGPQVQVMVTYQPMSDGGFRWSIDGREVGVVATPIAPMACIALAQEVSAAYIKQELQAAMRNKIVVATEGAPLH